METPSFLDNRNLRLLLFGGKGGVGKTTCAVAAARGLARTFPQSSILLVSADPAHSLTDSLAGAPELPNLQTLELEAGQCLADFKKMNQWVFQEITCRGTFLDNEDLAGILNLSLPGMDELMAFLQISQWVKSDAYDCIVVDTAPTGHTLRMLTTPAFIGKWLKATDVLLAKDRYLKKVIGGSDRPDALDRFLEDFAATTKRLETLLQDAGQARFIPVMLAESLSISETLDLIAALARIKVSVSEIVVNRLYPPSRCPTCADEYGRQMRELHNAYRRGGWAGYTYWGLPVYPAEVRGAAALDSFWDGVAVLDKTRITEPPKARDQWTAFSCDPPRILNVEGTAEYPLLNKSLLLFAGKGGVGKTTLACATAIYLAQERMGERRLLISVDPAHSLSDCLEFKVGPSPTTICPGLAVMEIDAGKEFSTLNRQYRRELEQFCSQSANLDLAFDHEAIEQLLDFSPPGLDEAMALTRLMESLAGGRYDQIILDTAPTGHLIRLLELPEMIEQWIKALFRLFLKYRRIFRLPQTEVRLVQISRNLKRLRALLDSPDRSAIYIVSMLTEMALAETSDLTDACLHMGIHPQALFVNLVTPPGDCPLCRAVNERESRVRRKFQRVFPDRNLILIGRQMESRGLPSLAALGQALYQTPVASPV